MSSSLMVFSVVASARVASDWPLAALAHVGAETTLVIGTVEVLLAYIDPGVAGFVIVSALGFISSIGYMARSYLARLKRRLFGNGEARAEGHADDEAANC